MNICTRLSVDVSVSKISWSTPSAVSARRSPSDVHANLVAVIFVSTTKLAEIKNKIEKFKTYLALILTLNLNSYSMLFCKQNIIESCDVWLEREKHEAIKCYLFLVEQVWQHQEVSLVLVQA